uniref:Uncharacterized protein n=1 Tax=viral metagenome TaxID=1070528 RepID=A0A6C0HAK4_9ZZZZ
MPKREPDNIFSYLNNQVHVLNNSKIFAGLMIIILNISSRFVNIKLSKSMESYLKHTFSKQILVFAIAWMGTREIYVALFITLIFTICFEYLFNENSAFCCLPESFKEYHIELLENADVTDEEIAKAKEVLEKAKKKNKDTDLKEYTISNAENYKNYLS